MPHQDVAGPELIGGHPGLDWMNTVAWRLDPQRCIDRLSDVDALLRFAVHGGFIDSKHAEVLRAQAPAREAAAAVTKTRRLRQTWYSVLRALATGEPPAGRDVELVERSIEAAQAAASIVDLVPLRWDVPVRRLADLPLALSLSAWRLLETEDLTRLRQCRDRGCGWLFLDRTKNSSRVWCSSADCGNRSRARRHYRRTHPTPSGAARA